jgi:hypothetical protein
MRASIFAVRAALLLLCAAACSENKPPNPDPDPDPVTGATLLYEPLGAQPVLPDINDVYLDPGTGRLNLPLRAEASAAELALTRDYLNTLNGFLTSSIPSARVSGPLDPSSVRESSVRVIQLEGTQSQSQPTISYSPQALRISIFPPQPDGWPKGARYAVVMVGGTSGLKDAQGRLVGPSASWERVRSTTALVDGSGRSTVSGLADADAQALEALRRRYASVLDQVAGQGIARENVALLWTFTVMSGSEVVFDLTRPIVPYPNDLYISPTTHLVQMPVP